MAFVQRANQEAWTDAEVVRQVLEGRVGAFEVIMRRYNQRLYRVALCILRDEGEAEDVMQETYVRAYEHLSQFEGRAQFSTWLTRIAVHEALSRSRKRKRTDPMEELADAEGEASMYSKEPDPERLAASGEMRWIVRQALWALPEGYRTVIMLRDIEEMSTDEAAEVLEITEENLKVRLFRARAAFRAQLFEQIGPEARSAFQFEAPRCDRIVSGVFDRLRTQGVDVHMC